MIIREKTSPSPFSGFAKVVVDIERRILSVGCDLHMDCAGELIRAGSLPKNLWGANIYPAEKKIDFVSLLNIRPADGNRAMDITIPEIKEKVQVIIRELLLS